MNDPYKNDVERMQRLIVSIKNDLNKRDQKNLIGQPVSLIEGEIRGQLTNLGTMYTIADREIELLAALMKNTESQLLQKEVEKRKNQLMDFRNQRQTLKDSFDKAIKEKKELNITQKSKQNIKEDTRFQEMSNSNLHQNQKQLEEQQDQQLDVVNEKLVGIKYQGQAINQTVTWQNKQLDKINGEVDQTSKEMMRTNNKLAHFVAKSSNCALIIAIVVELAILVCLIIFL